MMNFLVFTAALLGASIRQCLAAVDLVGNLQTFTSSTNGPAGLYFAPSGDLYVAEYNTQVISKLTTAAVRSVFYSPGSSFPVAVCGDTSGVIYLAAETFSNSQFTSINSAGTQIASTTSYVQAYGCQCDTSGKVYVADTNSGAVYRTDSSLASPKGVTVGSVSLVYSLWLDTANNKLYTAQTSGAYVYRFDLTQAFPQTPVVIAGTGAGSASDPGNGGAATSAQLGGLGYLAGDGLGNLFYGTNNACTLRTIDLTSGRITKYAGFAGSCSASTDGTPGTSATLFLPKDIDVRSSVLYYAEAPANKVRDFAFNYPTQLPSRAPTAVPTAGPTQPPTVVPTHSPTTEPTALPTLPPTVEPSIAPTQPPSFAPTPAPTPLRPYIAFDLTIALYNLTAPLLSDDVSLNATSQGAYCTALAGVLGLETYQVTWVSQSELGGYDDGKRVTVHVVAFIPHDIDVIDVSGEMLYQDLMAVVDAALADLSLQDAVREESDSAGAEGTLWATTVPGSDEPSNFIVVDPTVSPQSDDYTHDTAGKRKVIIMVIGSAIGACMLFGFVFACFKRQSDDDDQPETAAAAAAPGGAGGASGGYNSVPTSSSSVTAERSEAV